MVVFTYPFFTVMGLENGRTGKFLAYVPIDSPPESFDIRYTHSVHRTPVIESYYISENGTIIQYELSYENFAVGMPANANTDEGERFVQDEEGYKIKDMSRELPSIDLRTGQVVADHTLLVQNKEVKLSKVIEPGSWLHMESGTISLWKWMKGVNLLE